MTDPVIDAVLEYEAATAPAYEVIRRARARLLDRIIDIQAGELATSPSFARLADPTEPNGAELAVEAMSQPEQEQGARDASPAPASRPAAVPSPPGSGSPAITQPGAARSGARAPRRHGRRAPAADAAAAPSTSAPGSVGTPPPASHPCPECDKVLRNAQALGSHRFRAHGHRAGSPDAPATAPPSTPETPPVDRRVISEACPKCGRKFTWEPSLTTHVRSCTGTGTGRVPGGGE